MQLIIKDHILLIDHPELPKLKNYTYNLGGYSFSSDDNGILVFHKKQIKIQHLKNLGDGMEAIYIGKKNNLTFDPQAFHHALWLHQGFDEETGRVYGFFPGISATRVEEINHILTTLAIPQQLQNTPKGIQTLLTKPDQEIDFQTPSQVMSFLYACVLLYGKLETKPGDLRAIKTHIPLFGQAITLQDKLDGAFTLLAEQGIFVKKNILPAKSGVTYQISSHDSEILVAIADRHKALENLTKITKLTYAQEMYEALVAFLETDTQVPEAGKQDVLDLLAQVTTSVKFLAKEK